VEQVESPSAIGPELLKLLKQQRECYEQLQHLAQQQRALIKAEDSEALLALLGQRQRIVETIGKVHRQLAPYQQDWERVREQLDDECRREIEQLLGELQEMLNLLLTHDQEDCQELFSRKQQVAGKITAASKGRAATQAYGGGQAGRPTSNGAGLNLEISG